MSNSESGFLRSTTAATSIEYALIAMSVALVLVFSAGNVGERLAALYGRIGAALP